jgi:hypothetical protein
MGSQQEGPLVSERQSKCFRAAGEPPFGLSKQPPSARVASNHEGVEGALQALEPLAATAARPPSSLGESRPPPMKACTKGCLPTFGLYVYVDGGLLCGFPLLVPNHEPQRFFSK